MSVSPRLSFLVPVHDPPVEVFRRTLASIAAQTEPDFECILVDDGSRDSRITSELASRARNDRRFRVITRSVNGGIAAATNAAIEAATAPIVAFVDHDDVVSPEAAARVLDHFTEHPDHDVVYSDEDLIDADDRVVVPYHKPDYSPIRHLGHHYLCHLVAMRRETIGDLRVSADHEPAQDVDFVLRVIDAATERGHGVGHIRRTLYGWRAIAGSTALDVGEKSGVAEAVASSVRAALERRGVVAEVRPVDIDGRPSTNLRITVPGPTIDSVESVPLDRAVERLAETGCAHLHLTHDGRPPDPVLVAEAARDGIAMVGPTLLRSDGTIASVGRLVDPTLVDPFAGEVLGPGPWGAFEVAREVGAIAPEGAVIDVALARSVGGLAADVTLDAALAELSERLRRAGASTVWTPHVVDTVPRLGLDVDTTTVEDDWTICRVRLGGVEERWDTTGLQHHAHDLRSPLRRARDLILDGSVDLVTSDVFDTIVTRHTATPSDAFVRLGETLAGSGLLPAGMTATQFSVARQHAERRARAEAAVRHGWVDRSPECTLVEIWNEMPPSFRARAGAMLEHELANEVEVLRPLVSTLDVLRLAQLHGVPVVLVSDIYLSSAELLAVLERVGIDVDVFDAAVTSADRRRGKADGLLAEVVAERGVDPRRVVHLGDHDVSDVEAASRIGVRAIQTALPKSRRFVTVPGADVERRSAESGTDGGLTATARSVLLAAGTRAEHPAFQFGGAAVGPAMVGFARWVAARASELGTGSVHYLLREGRTIAEVVDAVAPDTHQRRLVHASRWVDMRAAVVDGTTAELFEALARRGPTSADHVAAAFELDAEIVRDAWLGTTAVDPSRLWWACSQLAADQGCRAAIVESAARLRRRVAGRLERDVDPAALAGDVPLVVCDVGWGATIQTGLERIFAAEGVDVEIVGLYLALSSAGEERLGRGHRIESYLPNLFDDSTAALHSRAVAHHADSIERVLMPPSGTFLDVAEDGSVVVSNDHEFQAPSLVLAKQGMFEFARRLAAEGIDDSVWVDDRTFRGALAASLARVVSAPTPELAAALSDWRHDDVAGAEAIPLGGSEAGAVMPYVTIRELSMLKQTERAWLEGLAAVHNPMLAAQIAAERAGVDADRLAPPTPGGRSRIAVFPVGSDLASLQVEHHPSATPAGWSTLRLTGSVDSLRSIRFDAAERAVLVEIKRWTCAVGRAGEVTDVDLADLTSRRLSWVDAWPVAGGRFVERPGGHVIAEMPSDAVVAGSSLDVIVVFRCWNLEADDPLLVIGPVRRVRIRARRAVQRVRRRLGR
ncbi:MAG: glycosyltransferase [Ilumatobacteraceae bacterium]